MTKNTTEEEYFADTTAISNSQLRNFVSYNKYGSRFLTPDKYNAFHVDKSVQFKLTDPIIVGKIVDIFFDGTGDKVWERYIPVAKRTGKAIKELIEQAIEDDEFNPDMIQWDYTKEEMAAWEIKKQGFIDDINKNHTEITKSMETEALEMIAWGKAFGKFKKFLKLKDTEAQVQLRKDIEITDQISGDMITVTMKWLPDFRNESEKLIVDLKTTGNMEMVIDALQFRWEPNLTANYIRQLSIYNKLSGGGYAWALAFVTDKWVKWVHIPNEILENAWEIIEKDILDLDKFLKDPDSIDESIFLQQDYETSVEDLTL